MRHTDYRILIDRGRKAGLGTAELYRAMGSRQPETGERPLGETDGNGFVSNYNHQGRREYCPIGHHGRS
jgi:hypothetical protein